MYCDDSADCADDGGDDDDEEGTEDSDDDNCMQVSRNTPGHITRGMPVAKQAIWGWEPNAEMLTLLQEDRFDPKLLEEMRRDPVAVQKNKKSCNEKQIKQQAFKRSTAGSTSRGALGQRDAFATRAEDVNGNNTLMVHFPCDPHCDLTCAAATNAPYLDRGIVRHDCQHRPTYKPLQQEDLARLGIRHVKGWDVDGTMSDSERAAPGWMMQGHVQRKYPIPEPLKMDHAQAATRAHYIIKYGWVFAFSCSKNSCRVVTAKVNTAGASKNLKSLGSVPLATGPTTDGPEEVFGGLSGFDDFTDFGTGSDILWGHLV